jgi:hypothetical protein
MLGSLRLLVTHKFDANVARTAIGAVLFLRFICPGLMRFVVALLVCSPLRLLAFVVCG